MEYHRISFIHDDTEYSFIKAMNAGLTGYDLMKACRVEVTIYMLSLIHISEPTRP